MKAKGRASEMGRRSNTYQLVSTSVTECQQVIVIVVITIIRIMIIVIVIINVIIEHYN